MRRRRDDEPSDLLDDLLDQASESLETLQDVIGQLANVDAAETTLVGEDHDGWPNTEFVVGEADDEPKRGEIAVDTRLQIMLSEEQARDIIRELFHAIREGTLLLVLDGRFFVPRKAAQDVRRALTEGDK